MCNLIIGTLPSSIGLFTSVTVLGFDSNKLTGSYKYYLLPSVYTLILNNSCFIIGTIPSTIGSLVALQQIYLSTNSFHGK